MNIKKYTEKSLWEVIILYSGLIKSNNFNTQDYHFEKLWFFIFKSNNSFLGFSLKFSGAS